jgi:hypothetical protein
MRFLIQRSGKQFDPAVLEILSQLSPEELDPDHDPDKAFREFEGLAEGSVAAAYPDAVTLGLPTNHVTHGVDKAIGS